jgi:hypothetical protein
MIMVLVVRMIMNVYLVEGDRKTNVLGSGSNGQSFVMTTHFKGSVIETPSLEASSNLTEIENPQKAHLF